MGCQVSFPLGFCDCAERKIEATGIQDHYTIGSKIGQGAYGVVSRCRSVETGEERAVKIMDTRVHRVSEVMPEADIMKMLSHPNIVKFHGLFYENHCVYIVMDAYGGGDMVDGLQTLMSKSTTLDCSKVVHVCRQIIASVEYLHDKCVVHRDIKGDNFLMDRRDMTDTRCRIALADFGAACELAPGQRLYRVVGTAKFSAPELFDRNYAEKVDMWALGVIMYGLVTGRFPFRNEREVRYKVVRMNESVDDNCQDLIHSLLDKDEIVVFVEALQDFLCRCNCLGGRLIISIGFFHK